MGVYVTGATAEIRGQLGAVGAVLPSCGFWELSSGPQVGQQAPFTC